MKVLTSEEYNSYVINQLHALGYWPRVLRMYKNCLKWYPDKTKDITINEFAQRFYDFLILQNIL